MSANQRRTKSASNKSESSASSSMPTRILDQSTQSPDINEPEDGNTRLMAAIQDNDVDLAIELIDTEPHDTLSLDAVNYENFTALQLACKAGMTEVALRLIDAGVDVNYLGGHGFRAIDYAIELKNSAQKVFDDADKQMKFAAEDEQWALVCEWQTDKLNSQRILGEIGELVSELAKHAPDTSSQISESDLREQFNKQLMRYVRNGNSSRVVWNPSNGVVLMSLIFLHIMRTYIESQCYVNAPAYTFGIEIMLDFDQDAFFLHSDTTADKKQNDKWNAGIVKKLAEQTVKCIKGPNSLVIVPVVFGPLDNAYRHANILIFRAREWTVEHYEPHGKTNLIEDMTKSAGRKRNQQTHEILGRIYSQFVDEVNKLLKRQKQYKERGPVKLRMSSEVCPTHQGFQAMQKRDTEFEGIALCSVWALFIAEMSAAYPTLSLRQIQGAVYHKMGEYDTSMAGDFLLNIMKGYATQILENTRMYCGYFDVEPAEWTFASFNKMADAEERVSWLLWFESKSVVEPDFAKHRLRAHRQGDITVGEQEAHYAEKYLRLKRKLACLEDTSDPMFEEPARLDPPANTKTTTTKKKTTTAAAKSKKRTATKGGRTTRRNLRRPVL